MRALEKWKKQHTPAKRISKLEPFKDDVMQLVSEDYTHEQIKTYLLDIHHIEISRQNISKFIAKQKTQHSHSIEEKKKTSTDTEKMQHVLDKYST